jgi:putative glutamine amidotransferase
MNKSYTNDDIRLKLIQNGALTIGILPTDRTMNFCDNDIEDSRQLTQAELKDLHDVLAVVDGVVLQGGRSSANYEVEIAKYCISHKIPILGICAGFNNIVRAAGGRVYQDKTGFHNKYQKEPVHDIVLRENSKIYEILGQKEIAVNSIHKMVTDNKNIGNLVATAKYAIDDTVEAVESPGDGFVMGIKWHPEIMISEKMNRIFDEFVRQCKK